MNITPQQLSKIREAMHLAGFFAENPSKEQTAKDKTTVKAAWAAFYEVEKGQCKMKTYDVTIQATVTKTIRVEAKDSNEATILAHEKFNVHSGEGDEHYDEQTLEISEVTA